MEQTYTGSLVVGQCCECSVAFGMPVAMDRNLRQNHRIFYCPNGHQQFYSAKSEAEKLREEKTALEMRVANLRDDVTVARVERNHAEHTARAHKAAHTRTKNRIHAGVCPHCKRSFPDVAAHMASKHPVAEVGR